MVENGVVKADAYLDGVETLITRYEADRYFAHRKEADWKLDLIERMGISVVQPTLPLEIIARRGPIGRTIVSFPSLTWAKSARSIVARIARVSHTRRRPSRRP